MAKVVRFPTKARPRRWQPEDLGQEARKALTTALILELGALYQEMWSASDRREYERAAELRDRIALLLEERR